MSNRDPVTWLHAPPDEAPPKPQRTKVARIERLRTRLDQIAQEHPHPIVGVVKGILDLLEQEL